MCPLVKDEFRAGLFLSQGPSKGIIEGNNNCHLGFGILLFQVRDLGRKMVAKEQHLGLPGHFVIAWVAILWMFVMIV